MVLMWLQFQVIDAAKYCYNDLSLAAMDNVNAFSKSGYEKMLQRIRASNPHGGSDIVQQTGTYIVLNDIECTNTFNQLCYLYDKAASSNT